MTIFLIPSPCNKSLASVCLIYLLPLILSTTPSYSIVFLPGWHFPCFTAMVHFISLIQHICRSDPFTHFSIIPSYLRSSPRLCSPHSSFQSLYHSSQLSLISASSISDLLYADDTQLVISFVLKKFLICH